MADHLCPVWIGHILASPLRRLFTPPEKILGPHVREGMTVLDVGCAMGFFSVPMASMVGPTGKVVCLDIQEKMLRSLEKRAKRAKVRDRIEMRVCAGDDLGLDDLAGRVDFAVAFAMVHEADDPEALIGQIYAALGDGGRLFVAEPKGHVSDEMFADTLRFARDAGFSIVEDSPFKPSHSVLLEK